MSFLGKCWPPAIDDRLIELAKTGKSASQIAEVLNAEFSFKFTRNSVGGRVFRLRKGKPEHADLRCTFQQGKSGDEWGGRKITKEQHIASSRQRWQQWESRNAGAVIHAINAAKAAATKRRNAERIEAMRKLHSENAVHFSETTSQHCKWPLWCDGAPFSELMCCGNKAEGLGPYCAGHAYKATNRVPGMFVPGLSFKTSWRAA